MPNLPPEIAALVADAVAGAAAVLGERLGGAYLAGSLATGGFDEHSDVDLIVVTSTDVSDAEFAALAGLHDRLLAEGGYWATQLEASYVPAGALRRFDPAWNVHPHVDRGDGDQQLEWVRHDEDWLVQRRVLGTAAITVAGPPPATLVDPVSGDDLRAAMRATLDGWWAEVAARRPPMTHRGQQSYTVLTLCRVAHTLATGELAGKREAAEAAPGLLGDECGPVIQHALEGRARPREQADPRLVAATYDLMDAVLAYVAGGSTRTLGCSPPASPR